MSTSHPVLAADHRSPHRTKQRRAAYLQQRKTVDPRAGVSPAPTSLHSFLVSPCSRPTLLDAMTDTGLPDLTRCGNPL